MTSSPTHRRQIESYVILKRELSQKPKKKIKCKVRKVVLSDFYRSVVDLKEEIIIYEKKNISLGKVQILNL
jgi:hypothetical protein